MFANNPLNARFHSGCLFRKRSHDGLWAITMESHAFQSGSLEAPNTRWLPLSMHLHRSKPLSLDAFPPMAIIEKPIPLEPQGGSPASRPLRVDSSGFCGVAGDHGRAEGITGVRRF